MADIARLIRLAVGLVTVFTVRSAWSVDYVPAQATETYTCINSSNSAHTTVGSSREAACSVMQAQKASTADRGWYWERKTYSLGTCNTGSCEFTETKTYTRKSDGGSAGDTTTSSGRDLVAGPQTLLMCGANSIEFTSGGSKACKCDSVSMPDVTGTKCEQYTCPPSGGYSAVTQPDQLVSNAGDNLCSKGCGYKPSSWKVGSDGRIWATWPFKSTGSFCGGDKRTDEPTVDSGEKNTKNPAPVPCGTNQCPGTVNGATICVPCRGTQDQGSTSAASAPAGSASGAGDTTTTKQTICDGVSCTTTTTTRDGSGSVTGQTQDTKPRESFCTENPASPLCKQSSFGGQCASTACEGDAVQCAIAADQYRRNCQWFDDPKLGALQEAGEAAMAGGTVPDGHPLKNATETDISFAGTLDMTDRLGSGCPVDVSVSVLGKSVAVPLSKTCGPLQTLGQLAVAVSILMAVFIVFRS